jgi:hypothetical protein
MRLRVIALTIVAFLTALVTNAHAVDYTQNGDFESPAIPTDSRTNQYDKIDSWSSSLFAPYLINGRGGNSGIYPSPYSGQQYVDLPVATDLIQTVTMPAGMTELSWYDNESYGSSASNYTLQINLNNGDGYIQTYTPNPGYSVPGGGQWRHVVFDFNAFGSGSWTIDFGPNGATTTADLLIDDVTLTQIPEPTSQCLLMLTFAAVTRRRRHRHDI